jgi:hypothetical protein
MTAIIENGARIQSSIAEAVMHPGLPGDSFTVGSVRLIFT